MLDEHYEAWRDTLRQVAVHDPYPRLRHVAEIALDDGGLMAALDVLAAADCSAYRDWLMAAYGALARRS